MLCRRCGADLGPDESYLCGWCAAEDENDEQEDWL